VGADILDKFVENTHTCDYQEEEDASNKKEMKDGAFDKWMAYLWIHNSNQSKYGSLLNGLVSQLSMDNNQYPKNVMSTTDILSDHKHDRRGNQGNQKSKKNWNDSKKEDNDETPSIITSSETSFAQNSKAQTCYCCGKKGHISPECPDKNSIEKKDWLIWKAELHMQAEQQDEQEGNESITDNASATSNRSSRVGWSALLIARSIEKESHYNHDREMGSRLRNWITLDNGSTLSLFSNPDLVEDIQTSSKTLVLATNAGVTQSNKEMTIPGFGSRFRQGHHYTHLWTFRTEEEVPKLTRQPAACCLGLLLGNSEWRWFLLLVVSINTLCGSFLTKHMNKGDNQSLFG
jgi:hypothetical protein